ncbi:MAG: hypothetical protein K2P94_00935 [Rhodospirillaceae bacterium]|nr:hypothetical protein [Rhodospirillaceae bacterium]
MSADSYLIERGQRLNSISAASDVAAAFPLLKVLRPSRETYARLRNAVTTYIWHTLSQAFPNKTFDLTSAVLEEFRAFIAALPNRTPNGVLLPRRQTHLSFNLVHQALADMFAQLGLLQHFSSIQAPVNIRAVTGTPEPVADTRPYSSSKIHTDVWNGEPLASILFNIPILGDVDAVALQFFEPAHFPESLRKPLNDYRLGDDVVRGAAAYQTSFEMNRIYMSDGLSLHQTLKRREGLRLSIDFRAIPGILLPGETAETSYSKAKYVATDAWRLLADTVIMVSDKPMDAFQRAMSGERFAAVDFSTTLIESP